MSGNGSPSERPGTSDDLRAEAARFHAEAAEIETGVQTSVARATSNQS